MKKTPFGFGCASLLQINEYTDRQRILEIAFENGIYHYDVARMYGLGLAESQLNPFLKSKKDQVSVATKFGMGYLQKPDKISLNQKSFRLIFKKFPLIKNTSKKIYSKLMHRKRVFSSKECKLSLDISLYELGVDRIETFFLHEPRTVDKIEDDLFETLDELCKNGKINNFGFSGYKDDYLNLIKSYPFLVRNDIQIESNFFNSTSQDIREFISKKSKVSNFGLIRTSYSYINNSFNIIPQLRNFWNEKLNIDLSYSSNLIAAMLSAFVKANPFDKLIFSTTCPNNLIKIMNKVNNQPWSDKDILDFFYFWKFKN